MWAKIVPKPALEHGKKPNICAECGAEVSIIKLNGKHSKYFCPTCTTEKIYQLLGHKGIK